MSERLIPARESLAWIVCFLAVATLIVVTGFTSTDSDSALYAGLADRLSQEPIARWLAPEWWGFWSHVHMSGLFREHPAGVLLLPAALARRRHSACRVRTSSGVAAGLGSLLLMAGLIRRFTVRDDARIGAGAASAHALSRSSSGFAPTTNTRCSSVCSSRLHGLVAASSGSLVVATLLVSFGLAAGLVIKGVFVAKILLAVGPVDRNQPHRSAWRAAPVDDRGSHWHRSHGRCCDCLRRDSCRRNVRTVLVDVLAATAWSAHRGRDR
jgi:hypothetical protein